MRQLSFAIDRVGSHSTFGTNKGLHVRYMLGIILIVLAGVAGSCDGAGWRCHPAFWEDMAMSVPSREAVDSGRAFDQHDPVAPDMSGRAQKSAETKPIAARDVVDPGAASSSASAGTANRAAQCQEMSADARRKCQDVLADPLTPIQHRAVELLAAGMRIATVARRLRIDERTIYRWKKQPLFVAAIRRECQMPITGAMLEQLKRAPKPEKPVYRFEGKTFSTAGEYLAEIERVSPAIEQYRRLPKWARTEGTSG